MKKARSLRRKEAKRLRKQQQRQRAERWNKTKKWIKVSATGILALLTVLGFAATLDGYYRSRLSISPETSSITSNGLQMPIKVSNDGILSVNDVRFSCAYKNAVAAGTTMNLTMDRVSIAGYPTQNVAEIVPGHPVTLFCQGAVSQTSGSQVFEMNAPFQLQHVEMEINVSFRPSFYFWHKIDTFKIAGVRGPDGVFVWMPH